MTLNTPIVGFRFDFANRQEILAYVQQICPHAKSWDAEIISLLGDGQPAAEKGQHIVSQTATQPKKHLDGDITAYIRQGMVTLDEIRERVLRKVCHPGDATKLVQALAWRDYFQRLYRELGIGLWEDIERYKTGFLAQEYDHQLPKDVQAGETGTCMDLFIHELYRTGYLHNHARRWLAAYIVHWRRVRWQTGAQWYLMHLSDGDPASNNLSWQWVASTFSSKPFFFNLDDLRECGIEVTEYNNRPFVGSKEAIAGKLFPQR